jgi:hypothetical protein
MTDYAAAPVQPIVQGLISFVNPDVPGDGISFFGIGVIQTGPNGPSYVGPGHYILTLDPGLPGDVAIDPAAGLFQMTVRGPSGIVAGAPTAIDSKAVNYILSPVRGVGATKIEIFLAAGATPTDFETGLEIVLRRGDAGVELVNANLIGPLFPNN